MPLGALANQRGARRGKNGARLLPGPPGLPLLGNLLLLRRSSSDVEALLRRLVARHGPVVSLRVGSTLSIFVADRRLAHAALVESGAALADRPAATRALLGEGDNTISRSSYGPGASSAATSSPRRCTRRGSGCSRPRARGCAARSRRRSGGRPRRPRRRPP